MRCLFAGRRQCVRRTPSCARTQSNSHAKSLVSFRDQGEVFHHISPFFLSQRPQVATADPVLIITHQAKKTVNEYTGASQWARVYPPIGSFDDDITHTELEETQQANWSLHLFFVIAWGAGQKIGTRAAPFISFIPLISSETSACQRQTFSIISGATEVVMIQCVFLRALTRLLNAATLKIVN